MKLKTTLLAAAASILTAPAAFAGDGWYGTIGAGYTIMNPDLDTEITGGGFLTDTDADYDGGFGVLGAVGKSLGNGFRAELEYSYRNNDARFIALDGQGGLGSFIDGAGFTGQLESHVAVVNLIYELDIVDFITPYIGGGVGYSRIIGEFNGTSPTGLTVNDGESGVVGQAIAGFEIPLSDQVAFDVSYRYLQAEDAAFTGTIGAAAANTIVESSYINHSVFGALRFYFGAPAASVEFKDCWDGSSVPVTAECPPQVEEVVTLDPVNFTVYFDYNKSNLTREASSLIQEAASRALSGDIETVVVAGNTDTSGGAAYNQRLSQRRAAVVRDALIANGVPADRIRTEANGENNLAKATPDGTREPLNRRTEVMISFE
ncbi:MAG: OmpA family protein [Pseudomonadota bacterium]